MSRQFWSETVSWATASGTAVTGIVEAILFPNVTIPANFMQDGRALRITIFGQFSNIVTTPGTLTLRFRWGGVAGTVLAASAAISLNVAAQTNQMWGVEAILQTRSNGSAGSIMATAMAEMGVEATTSPRFMGSAGAASPAAVTVDLTADTALSVTAIFSLTGNSIQGLNYTIEALN